MVRKFAGGRTVAHLGAVWCVGCALTALQFQAVVLGLLSGTAALATVLVVGPPLAVSLFAGLGTSARAFVPLTRRARGLWGWAVTVYAAGTAGPLCIILVSPRDRGLSSSLLLYPCGGVCAALAAAFFLPGARTRLATLGVTVVFAAVGCYVSWSAAQPPTLPEWLSANGVDRALLRVGDPPAGYTLRVGGASEDGFGASYERPGSPELQLSVEREGHDTRRTDARGCPVPFDERIHCADDGAGRQLVSYEGDYARQELRLRRAGLVHTVTLRGSGAGLPAARHILSTLRPATDAELAALVGLPMRQ
ncbi:hypothetical protein OHA45_36350 [Streptomyces lydicus]|uniref:hypothetical protein n=1 Tax=Streptomyces lydicus TaxID=47763 RepID=UPI002E31CA01|nr:hypothetical protein [Streptomyces lydicus]